MLCLHATLDPKRTRILTSLSHRIGARANAGQVRLSMWRFQRRVVFQMRENNIADYHIGSEFVLQEYDFSSNAKFNFIVDGGANIGMFSIQAAIVNPSAQIIAYEPNSDNIQQLNRNLTENGVAVEVRESALWSTETELFFNADTSMSGSVSRNDRGTNDRGTKVTAELPKLSENMWLKLDIEGAEYEVLPVVLKSSHLPLRIDLEIHDHDKRGKALCQLLKDAGYTLIGDVESDKPCIFVKATLRKDKNAKNDSSKICQVPRI